MLNDFLADIPENELKKLDDSNKSCLQKHISKAELIRALYKIKIKKSCGMDGISTKLSKKSVQLVPDTFLNAFNECFSRVLNLSKVLKQLTFV